MRSPEIFYSSLVKRWLIWSFGSSLFLLCMFCIIRISLWLPRPLYHDRLVGGEIILGISVWSLIFALRPQSVSLLLEEDGFTICTSKIKNKVKWSDVERFETKKFRWKTVVIFWISGTNIPQTLPDNFGKSADEFIVLLNKWRLRAVS